MTAVDVRFEVDGRGPAVYMVHGIGSRASTWEPLVAGLADRFTCVRYDLRGHGASPAPPPPYRLDDMVADLEALRARLGHEQLFVLGHSLGGMIGPAWARRHPERALGVGLLSTAAGRSADDRARLAAVGDAMRGRGVMPVIDTLVERWYTDAFIAARPDLVARRKEQVATTPEDVFLAVFDLYATTEMAPWLGAVRCPCLVLTGELDGGCPPRLNRFIADTLPDAELVILDGLKHSVLVEAPERVLPPVRDFLLRSAGLPDRD